MKKSQLFLFGLGFAAVASFSPAASVTYTIDPRVSSLTFSVNYSGLSLLEQVPGSLTAQYQGTITGDLSGSTLIFSGGSFIQAVEHSGAPFAPTGHAGDVDNYAAAVPPNPFGITGTIAFRNIVFDILEGAATHGSPTTATFAFTSGHFDYDSPPPGPGTGDDDLDGIAGPNFSAGNVSLLTEGSVETLRIPVLLAFQGDVSVQIEGQLVATRVIPEPSSAALLALGGLLLRRR